MHKGVKCFSGVSVIIAVENINLSITSFETLKISFPVKRRIFKVVSTHSNSMLQVLSLVASSNSVIHLDTSLLLYLFPHFHKSDQQPQLLNFWD